MKSSSAIYMDHHATTPTDSRVLERMLPFFNEDFCKSILRVARPNQIIWLLKVLYEEKKNARCI